VQLFPSVKIRLPTGWKLNVATTPVTNDQGETATVVLRQDPVEGLPPWRVGCSGEKTSHPHSLEGSNLGFRIQETNPTEPGRTPPNIHARFQVWLAGPHRLPREPIDGIQRRASGHGQTSLIPELAENLAVNKEGTALEGTRPVTKGDGDCAHPFNQGRPILQNPLGGPV
jgi:hypothetical protein